MQYWCEATVIKIDEELNAILFGRGLEPNNLPLGCRDLLSKAQEIMKSRPLPKKVGGDRSLLWTIFFVMKNFCNWRI